jgi:hypothetical protein
MNVLKWGRGRAAALAASGLLLACATPPPAPPPAPSPAPKVEAPAPPPPPQLSEEELARQQMARLRALTKVDNPEPPLSVNLKCRFRDEMGYAGRLKLKVKQAEVEQLEAEVRIPKHGQCRFRLADFDQTERLPSILLAARGDACRVHLWSRDKEATVAFRGCAAQCTNGSHEYLWPIMVRMDKGSCF